MGINAEYMGAAFPPPRRPRTGPNHQKMAAAAAARALLDKNGDLTVEQYSAGLAKILGNILAHPAEEKYRRIKAKAKLVQQTILAADGGLAAFLALGFRKEAMTVTAPPPP